MTTSNRLRDAIRRTGKRLLCIAQIGFVLCCLSACKAELYTKISEPEANEMVAVLAASGMRSTKLSPDGKTWTVMIEESDIPKALEALRAQGLPRDRTQSLGDVFKKEGLVSTPSEERIRFIYAMSQELSRTLSQIDGVITARVHVVIPANDPLSEKLSPSSASVFIKHRPSLNIQAITPAIKMLVQRSIEGLSYDNVSVLFFPADTFHGAVPPTNTWDLAWYEWLGIAALAMAVILVAVLAHPDSRRLFTRGAASLRVTAVRARRRATVGTES
jgi:type III secretion protein J